MALAHQFRQHLVRVSVCLLGMMVLVGCTSTDEVTRAPLGVATENPVVQTAAGYRIEPVLIDLCDPVAIAVDGEGNLYVVEQGMIPEAQPRILRVMTTGHIDVLTDKLNGPVHCIRWENGRLMVWDGEETAWLGPLGERKGVAGPPRAVPNRTVVDVSGGFGTVGDRFVIAGGRVIRRGQAGDEMFLDAASGPSGSRRLVDLAFGPGDKALYVADLGPVTATSPAGPVIGGNGVVWRITPQTGEHLGPPARLSPPQQFGVSRQATRPSL